MGEVILVAEDGPKEFDHGVEDNSISGGTVILLPEDGEAESEKCLDDESVLDSSIESFFRHLTRDGAIEVGSFSSINSQLSEGQVAARNGKESKKTKVREDAVNRKWTSPQLLTLLCLFGLLVLGGICLSSRTSYIEGCRRTSIKQTDAFTAPISHDKIQRNMTPEGSVVIELSPRRLAASALLGSLTFFLGIPGIPGLGDNALLGVLATIAPLLPD